MSSSHTNALEERIISTNVGFFLREFSISRTKYTPPGKSEVELADHVVLVGDILFIIQSKNRDVPSSDPVREAKWYRDNVKRIAAEQIRSTLAQLKSAPPFPNDHGEATNIPRDLEHLRVFKLVIYNASAALPQDLRRRKHREDEEAGFVHVFHVEDYELVLRTMATLPEVTDYLSHREEALRQYEAAGVVTERALLGDYLMSDRLSEPREENAEHVDRLVVDEEPFDISGILRSYRDKIYSHHSEGPAPAELHTHSSLGPYHVVLRQLFRLSRTGLVAFKKRFIWARERCEQRHELPSIFGLPQPHSIAFTFIPIPKGTDAAGAGNALLNFTELAKHRLQADRALGISFRRDGCDYLIDWMFVERPWSSNTELDEILLTHNPFGPLQETFQPRYRFKP